MISFGDLLASRNAVVELIQVLTDQADPPSEVRRDSVRIGIRYAVPRDGEPYMFDDFEEAVDWLVELRDRLGGYLPTLPPGRR